jgi:hypothetical protein
MFMDCFLLRYVRVLLDGLCNACMHMKLSNMM